MSSAHWNIENSSSIFFKFIFLNMFLKLTQYFICFMYITGIECIIEDNVTTIIAENILALNKSNLILFHNNSQTINRHNVIVTENNRLTNNNEEHVKKKKARNKRKKRRRKVKAALVQDEITEPTTLENTTSDVNISTSKTTKRRKRKKKRRKKKQNYSDILEITTLKNTFNSTFKISNDTAVVSLIKQLNENPEDDFSNIRFHKTGKYDNILNNRTITENSLTINLAQHLINSGNATKFTKKRNRCSTNNGGCSQICKDRGKTKCSCLKGYTLAKNRKKCVDIDECKFNNGGCKEICTNTLGAYYCDCPLGFRIADDLKSCQDINECHLRNGHGPCQDTCTNTYGSYICNCSNLNGTRLGNDKHSCQDINECDEGTSGCSHLCINTIGRAFCSCPEGMELMSDYKTCQDLDECEDPSIKKTCMLGCVNTVGSYYCEDDFQNDQSSNKKKVPVCPPLDPPRNGFITCLRNNSLPYDSYTKSGRKIIRNSPGTKCRLMCPAGFKLIGGDRFVCGITGTWIIKKSGFCTKAAFPTLECPPDQLLSLEEQDKIKVRFPPPRTNVRWKIVKSYPRWAKNLNGELGEGHHNIQFSVTDPSTKLSSTCSFSIVIKKQW